MTSAILHAAGLAGARSEQSMNPSTATVEVIRDPGAFTALRDRWNALLAESKSDCVFLTWDWLYTWWRHLGRNSLFVVTVRRSEELLGVLPLFLDQPSFGHLVRLQPLRFLGTGNVGSDYLDMILKPGAEQECFELLGHFFTRQRFVLDLGQLARSSAAAVGLGQSLKGLDWRSTETTTNVSPFINLSGHTWESYLASLGSGHRYAFRRKSRALSKHFDVRFEVVQSKQERAAALATLMELHDKRWQHRGGSEAFHTAELRSFHEEWSRIALENGWLRLFILRLDGDPAAAVYGFRYRKIFYYYQAGFDPRYARHSVGLLIMGLAIKSAIEEGAAEYDLLHGDEGYKSHWSRQARELVRLELYPPSAAGWLWQSAAHCLRGTKRLVWDVLPRPLLDALGARPQPRTLRNIYASSFD